MGTEFKIAEITNEQINTSMLMMGTVTIGKNDSMSNPLFTKHSITNACTKYAPKLHFDNFVMILYILSFLKGILLHNSNTAKASNSTLTHEVL